ncbi:MAG: hypothetical protein R3Y54_11930, partial [Eubacteriales bacterium]
LSKVFLLIVEPGTDVEEYIRKAAEIFPFVRYQEQIRIGKNNIEKRHFKFTYLSPVNKNEFYILLDVLYEENHYERTIQKEIKNDLVLAVYNVPPYGFKRFAVS